MLAFNAQNEQLKKLFEEVLLHGTYRQQRTVDTAWKALNLYEEYTCKQDFTTLCKQQVIGFKGWLEKKQNMKGEPYSLSYIRATYRNIREFYKWLGMHPKYSRKINVQAISYLHLSENQQRASCASREKPVPIIEEINRVLLAMPTGTDIEKRDRAIIAFTALTGVRDAALISLKMKDVDLKARNVWQDPNHVKTKYKKGIETFFMPFDPLWEEIVDEWIQHARETLNLTSEDALFPKTLIKHNPKNLCFANFGLSKDHWANATAVRQIFKEAFKCAGLQYYNPHSFRNMLAHWAMENCSQKEFKAVSQNLGHENVPTTYNAYGKLSLRDQKQSIAGIGQRDENLKRFSSNELLEELKKRTE